MSPNGLWDLPLTKQRKEGAADICAKLIPDPETRNLWATQSGQMLSWLKNHMVGHVADTTRPENIEEHPSRTTARTHVTCPSQGAGQHLVVSNMASQRSYALPVAVKIANDKSAVSLAQLEEVFSSKLLQGLLKSQRRKSELHQKWAGVFTEACVIQAGSAYGMTDFTIAFTVDFETGMDLATRIDAQNDDLSITGDQT